MWYIYKTISESIFKPKSLNVCFGRWGLLFGIILIWIMSGTAFAEQYYAYEAVEDSEGVIAPWHSGQNGQCDFRIRVAAETIKRFPWVDGTAAIMPAGR